MHDAYETKISPTGDNFAVIIPKGDREILWRAYLSMLENFQGQPIAKAASGAALRKLGYALRGET